MLKGIILIEDTEGQFRTQFYILRAEMQFVKNSYPYALAWYLIGVTKLLFFINHSVELVSNKQGLTYDIQI